MKIIRIMKIVLLLTENQHFNLTKPRVELIIKLS